ncbi:MAG: CBS domain-containing protein [Candidatus Aenigmarchaeota archaeon]|nr:CBS domain-containing protein [Candidatus Aenigmarchaeota archaeon]
MKLKDVMTRRVITVSPEDKIVDVIKILTEEKISGVPVVKGRRIVGIVTEADILRALGKKELIAVNSEDIKALRAKGVSKVEKIMKKDVIVINENESLDKAIFLMGVHRIKRLPVVDDKNVVVGIVSREDILNSIAKLMSTEEKKKFLAIMETDVDKILSIIKEKGRISFDKIAKLFNVDMNTVENWAKILEDHGLAEIFYPAIGSPELREKKK